MGNLALRWTENPTLSSSYLRIENLALAGWTLHCQRVGHDGRRARSTRSGGAKSPKRSFCRSTSMNALRPRRRMKGYSSFLGSLETDAARRHKDKTPSATCSSPSKTRPRSSPKRIWSCSFATPDARLCSSSPLLVGSVCQPTASDCLLPEASSLGGSLTEPTLAVLLHSGSRYSCAFTVDSIDSTRA
jgi:hypothetical protein